MTKELYIPKEFIVHATSLRQGCPHCARFLIAAPRRSLGRISVPVRLTILSDQLPVVAMAGRYPAIKLIGRKLIPKRIAALDISTCEDISTSGINPTFAGLSQTLGQIAYVLRDRSPLIGKPKPPSSLDLHFLDTSLAFVLSQDQTLHKSISTQKGKYLVESYPSITCCRLTPAVKTHSPHLHYSAFREPRQKKGYFFCRQV